jgi:transmembrane sensor
MTTERLRQLLNRYLSRQTSPAEEQELYNLINTGEYDNELKDQLKDNWNEFSHAVPPDEERADRMLRFILDQREAAPVTPWYKKTLFRRVAAAAAIISLLFVSVFYIFLRNNSKEIIGDQSGPGSARTADVAPGHNGAILRLADGSSIILDSAHDGVISLQGSAVASKDGMQLSYVNKGKDAGTILYNTIETPRGRQFQLTLEDGTRVWLNALSSIRFPVVFNGTNRPVEISGEVYFEVAKNKEKPFIVHTGGMQVQVLGTHFNVNAYSDGKAIKTTLMEGSVKVSKDNETGVLQPGQQAQLSGNGKIKIQEHADIEEVLAWKNGRIAFTNASLEDIMRQVSKWYDVEVVYAGPVTERTFTADISRNTNLSEFLKVMELSKIHFSIEGRKLIVKP